MPWIRQVPARNIVIVSTHFKPLPGPVEATANTIGYANTAMNQLDTAISTYLQPLSKFNAVITGIGKVRPSKRYS